MASAAVLKRNPAPSRTPTKHGSVPVLRIARRSDLENSDEGIDMTTLGGRLAKARLGANLTQEALGEAIDKVRATINAYETDKIVPPLPIVQRLAKTLNVSPSFLAFGEHGIATGVAPVADAMVNIDEITYGRDGHAVSGSMALSRRMAETYVDNVRSLKAYVLNHSAPHFGFQSGDLLLANSSVTEITNQYDTYLIEVPGGMEIVRPKTVLGGRGLSITVEGPRGDTFEVRTKSLKVIGAVVGSLSRQT